MMYTAFLLCLMMIVPYSWAEGNVCLKRIVSPASQSSCVADNNCPKGEHFNGTHCVIECVNALYGQGSFQYYCGIDVICSNPFDTTAPDLQTCVDYCENEDDCISGSYDPDTSTCSMHECDYLGGTTYNTNDSNFEIISDVGINTVYFVKNCLGI